MSPDAQWVFYNTLDETGNSAYWKAPFEGGAPVKLRGKVSCLLSLAGDREQKLTDWQIQASLYDFAWSRDNKQLAVTRDMPKSEIILIQNFR